MTTTSVGTADVEALLHPSNVAIVGARDEPGTWPDRIRANLRRFGFPGEVYGVNPRRDSVWGGTSFPDLESLPERPDHALVIVPAGAAVAAVTGAVAAGARSATIMSGGFTPEQITQIQRTAAEGGLALSGPNCLGNVSVPARLVTTTDDRLPVLLDGPVAVVGQSGGIVMAINRLLTARGIGSRFAVSSGNESCLTTADYVRYFARLDDLRVVVAFVESVKDWADFASASQALHDAGKHLVALKVGQAPATRHAAASHTGALAGAYEAFAAVAGRSGVITVDSIDCAVEACELLSRVPRPRGPRVAAVTISGGVRELLLDAAHRQGAQFATLSEETSRALADHTDGETDNPLDTGYAGISSIDTLIRCVEIVAADPAVDIVLLQEELLGRPQPGKEASIAKLDARFAGGTAPGTDTPVALFSMATVHVTEFGRELRHRTENLAYLQVVDTTLRTLTAVGTASLWHRDTKGSTGLAASRRDAALAALPRGRRAWTEVEAQSVFEQYGLQFPTGGAATTVDEAVAVADGLGYPVVLKAVSREVTHKSDVGGVAIGIDSPDALRTAGTRMAAAIESLEGFLVSSLVSPDRVDAVVGFTTDAEVGPVVVVGSGGVDAELYDDAVLLPAPCAPDEVRRLIAPTALGTRLGPWRGQQPCDTDALVDAVCAVSELAHELSDVVASAEVNPLALVRGGGVVALDALLEPRDRP